MNRDDVVEALEGVEAWEHDDQRELSRLYNHKPDDSPQFNRGQMRVAIRHGKRLALASLSEAQPEEGLVGELRNWKPWSELVEVDRTFCGAASGEIYEHKAAVPIGNGRPKELMCRAADEIERLTALSRNHDEARTLWLWRNGEGEYVAYDNPFPTRDGGDPLTLGGPCGRAILRASINGRPEYPEDQVVADIARALKGGDK